MTPSPFQTLSYPVCGVLSRLQMQTDVTAQSCLGSPYSSSESQGSASVHEDKGVSGFDSLSSYKSHHLSMWMALGRCGRHRILEILIKHTLCKPHHNGSVCFIGPDHLIFSRRGKQQT